MILSRLPGGHQCPICNEDTPESRPCRGCANFFSRNKTSASFPCVNNDNNCQITPTTRNRCRGCRLRKCWEYQGRDRDAQDAKENDVPERKRSLLGLGSGGQEVKRQKAAEVAVEAVKPAEPAVVTPCQPESSSSAPPSSAPSTSTEPLPKSDQIIRIRKFGAIPSPETQRAVSELGYILPDDDSYDMSLINNPNRPDLLRFALYSAERQHRNWAMRLFASHPMFVQLDAASKTLLLHQSFFLSHILDATWGLHRKLITMEHVLSDQKTKVPTTLLAVFGNEQALPTLNSLLEHLFSTDYDKCDYALFRQLSVFDVILMETDLNYQHYHLRFLNAWKRARKLDVEGCKNVMEIFKCLKFLARLNKSHLIKQRLMGRIIPSATPIATEAMRYKST